MLAATAVIAGALALPAGASDQPASATASKTACTIAPSETRDLGTSYVYTLKVRNLSCEKGKNLVVKYHQCRHDNGGADGNCSGFKGYSCDERKTAESPAQYSAKAKCVKGSKKFVQTYAQNT